MGVALYRTNVGKENWSGDYLKMTYWLNEMSVSPDSYRDELRTYCVENDSISQPIKNEKPQLLTGALRLLFHKDSNLN
jgi:hypothetical protein